MDNKNQLLEQYVYHSNTEKQRFRDIYFTFHKLNCKQKCCAV